MIAHCNGQAEEARPSSSSGSTTCHERRVYLEVPIPRPQLQAKIPLAAVDDAANDAPAKRSAPTAIAKNGHGHGESADCSGELAGQLMSSLSARAVVGSAPAESRHEATPPRDIVATEASSLVAVGVVFW